MDSSLKDKQALFSVLDELRRNSDEEDGIMTEDEMLHRKTCRSFFESAQKSSVTRRAPSSPQSTVLAPVRMSQVIKATQETPGQVRRTNNLDDTRSPCDQDVSFIGETPIEYLKRPNNSLLRRALTLPNPSSSLNQAKVDQSPSMSRPAQKQKLDRSSSVKPVSDVSEENRIFGDFSFFYLPNDNIDPLRRKRIERAQEYGARWVRSLDEATHMIVDKKLQQKDIAKTLTAPHSTSLIVVIDTYPLDCMDSRTLFDADQAKYQVRGTSNHNFPPQPVPVKEGSLHVKEARQVSKRIEHDTTGNDSDDNCGSNHDTSVEKGVAKSDDKPSERFESRKSRDKAVHDQVVGVKDELSEIIRYVQANNTFLSDDEDSDAEPEDPDSSDEEPPSSTSRKRGKEMALEERFACYSGGTKDKCSEQAKVNARTIEVLQEMADFYASLGVNWKPQAYRRAVGMLRKQTNMVATEEEARKLPGVGARLASKIAEIARTGSLEALECERDDPQNQIREMFLKIYDIGVERANKWIARGFRTLDDIPRAELSKGQRIGLDHFDDLNTRIPRAEVAALGEHVKREAARIDAAVELLIGGSYRRGSDTSGDIDLIVTKKGSTCVTDLVPFFEQLEEALTEQGFLVAELTGLTRNPTKGHGGGTWHGCCVLPQSGKPGLWRRIDFLLVPETEFGAALIYFTGNDIFNRSMRLLARKKGMRLNQRGLYRGVLRDARGKKLNDGELAEGKDEKRIFEMLGLVWRPPEERWC